MRAWGCARGARQPCRSFAPLTIFFRRTRRFVFVRRGPRRQNPPFGTARDLPLSVRRTDLLRRASKSSASFLCYLRIFPTETNLSSSLFSAKAPQTSGRNRRFVFVRWGPPHNPPFGTARDLSLSVRHTGLLRRASKSSASCAAVVYTLAELVAEKPCRCDRVLRKAPSVRYDKASARRFLRAKLLEKRILCNRPSEKDCPSQTFCYRAITTP